jgi:hypothetical protein
VLGRPSSLLGSLQNLDRRVAASAQRRVDPFDTVTNKSVYLKNSRLRTIEAPAPDGATTERPARSALTPRLFWSTSAFILLSQHSRPPRFIRSRSDRAPQARSQIRATLSASFRPAGSASAASPTSAAQTCRSEKACTAARHAAAAAPAESSGSHHRAPGTNLPTVTASRSTPHSARLALWHRRHVDRFCNHRKHLDRRGECCGDSIALHLFSPVVYCSDRTRWLRRERLAVLRKSRRRLDARYTETTI